MHQTLIEAAYREYYRKRNEAEDSNRDPAEWELELWNELEEQLAVIWSISV